MRLWLAAIAAVLIATGVHAAGTLGTFAFYYGRDIPWEALGAFDVAVVEPGHVGPTGWAHRLNPDTTVAAYVSVGEVHPTRPYFAQLRPEWKLGENRAWGSVVVDQAAPGWSAFYLAQVVRPLWQQGYRAFFLDTLDSFQLVAKTPQAQQRQVAGLAALVQEIKRAYPDARLILNRGFEILPQVHGQVDAVVAESLFQGWDAERKEYREVTAEDRDWLLAQLRKCRDEYRLPVVAIDYVPPENRALARETARRIKALGIVPWVATPELDNLGVGQVEVLPRQVLAIHDEPGNLSELATHEIHRVGTLPLNYLGLDAKYVYYGADEMRELAEQPLAGRYAGVVTWFNRGSFDETPALMKLLNAARVQGVPVVMVGALPGDTAMNAFGVDIGETKRSTTSLTLEKLSKYTGFEIEPKPLAASFTPATVRQGEVWLRVRSAQGERADVVAVTPWGGFAADRYWKVDLPQDNGERWVVDPIAFFRAALRVAPGVPVPDVTTETGRRLLMVHVDGDGFPSRAEIPGTPIAGEHLLREFLERYRWPSTISIIEGEVSPRGLYPALSAQMEATARRIFALPHVEIASHTWSHPFFWADSELGRAHGNAVMALPIPGYRYDPVREIVGARDYINTLAPPGKKTRMVLWSGDTQPLAEPVKLAYQAGLLNMNGGDTLITRAEPSLTLVGPLGMMKGDWFQVYAPNQNENVYTNDWTGPFYGYERMTETYEMTDLPLRLKPVDMYYHLYIVTKRASIASLHKVYGWAEARLKAQTLHPVYASEYAERVLDWRRATVARTDGGLELRGGRFLREWRIEADQPLPAFSPASGFAGHLRHASVEYLHASKSIANYDQGTRTSAGFYLESANARLISWTQDGALQRLAFEGHLPLNARLVAPGCELQGAVPGLRASRSGEALVIEGSQVGQTTVVLRCAG
nr:bifunctional glycoside hydrolase 114/ polysaccharide deacetylase family protein [Variovorax terrae]